MKEITKRLVKVEIHQLNMPYANSRLQDPKAVKRLADLMARQGQKVELIAATDGKIHTLIDGHLRVAAARRCGWDTIWVELWECDVQTALTRVLAASQSRRWEPIEQAQMIKDLMRDQQCSVTQIALDLGREPASVSKCLEQLAGLTDDVFDAVRKGTISSRDARRVIIPLMRANEKHGRQLLQAQAEKPLGSRQLDAFLGHYRTSTRKVREEMIAHPAMFIKAHEYNKEERAAKKLKEGIEGDCLCMLRQVRSLIKRLRRQGRVIFAEGGELARANLFKDFDDTNQQWQILNAQYQRSRDAQSGETTDHSEPACAGVLGPQNQQTRQGRAQHGPQDHQGEDSAGGERAQGKHIVGPVGNPVQTLRQQCRTHPRDPGQRIRADDRLFDADSDYPRG